MSNFKNQKAIFSENLAGFLIMRGHWLHSQKKDLRKPNSECWVPDLSSKKDRRILKKIKA